MRQRTTGLVALGAGVFFLVLAVLLRFYAVPTLEVVPKDYWTHYTATGKGTVLDSRDGTTKSDVALTQDITIRGNTAAADRPSGSVVWDYASELSFATPDGGACNEKYTRPQCPVSISLESVAFDDFTAAVKEWKHDTVDTNVTQAGQAQTHPVGSYISKFPFEMTKKDYPLWDTISGTAPMAHYVDTEKVDGLTVWRYQQTIGTKAAPVLIYHEPKIPPALVGDIPEAGKIVPVYEYSVTNVLVDPVSGIPVAGDQNLRVTAGSLDGSDSQRLTLLETDLKLDDVQVTDNNDKPKFDSQNKPVMTGPGGYTTQSVRDAKRADRILLLKNTLPLIGLILGVLLLVLGIFLTMRGAASEGAASSSGGPRQAEEERTKTLPAAAEEEN